MSTSPTLRSSLLIFTTLVGLPAGGALAADVPPMGTTLAQAGDAPAAELPAVSVSGTETAGTAAQGYVARRDITGTKTETPLIETPQSISVITRDEIDQRQAQTLGEALRYTAGVRTEAFGPDSRTDWFQIRGFDANDTGIFLNGLRYAVGFSGSVYETYGLQSYDVLRGPSSVLYGQMAPGGIVNQVSRMPTQTPQGEVRLTAGSYNRYQAQTSLSGPIDANGVWSYSLTALGRLSDTQVQQVNDDRVFLAPALTYRPDADTTLTILPYYQRDRTAGGQFLPYVGTVQPTPFGRISTSRFTGEPDFNKFDRTQYGIGYALEHRVNDVLSVSQNLRLAHTGINWDQVYGGGLNADQRSLSRFQFGADVGLDTFQVDNRAQLRFNTGAAVQHTLLAGLDYSRVNFTNVQAFTSAPSLDLFVPVYGNKLSGLGAPYLNTRQVTSQIGLYAQDQIRVLDQLVFTLGIRQDMVNIGTNNRVTETRTNQNDSVTTGRAGVVYLAPFGIAPYFSYSRSFLPTIGTTATGTPFVPTQGEQYEVGVKFQPPGINSFITTSAFQITQNNVLETDPNNFLNQIQVGQIRVRGIEVEGVASLAQGLNLIANYTYLDPEVTRSAIASEVGTRPQGVPKTTAAAYLDYTFGDEWGRLAGLGIGFGTRFVGNTATAAGVHDVVPSVTLFDAALRYDFSRINPKLKGVSAQINASNLADTRYVSRCTSDASCFYGNRLNVLGSLIYRY